MNCFLNYLNNKDVKIKNGNEDIKIKNSNEDVKIKNINILSIDGKDNDFPNFLEQYKFDYKIIYDFDMVFDKNNNIKNSIINTSLEKIVSEYKNQNLNNEKINEKINEIIIYLRQTRYWLWSEETNKLEGIGKKLFGDKFSKKSWKYFSMKTIEEKIKTHMEQNGKKYDNLNKDENTELNELKTFLINFSKN